MKFKRKLQRHADAGLPNFCNYSNAAAAVAGKDVLLMIYDENDELLALAGQKSLTINRSADNIEVSSKDTEGGWKSSIAGMKEWSIDTDGLYVASDSSMKTLAKAFADSDPVCLVVKNIKTDRYMFGGQAFITDFPLEAPYDDALTYSITLSGNGALVDLSQMYVDPAQLRVEIPASSSVEKTAQVIGAKGTVAASVDYTGVSASVSDDVLTVEVASTAEEGLARVTVTDTYSGGADTYEVLVILDAPAV